jgi:hypothetical protein
VVRAYQEACAKVIARYEGHIAQYLGDGLLVYFGYPQAHEDDAQRAVRASLDMLEALGTLNTRLAQDKSLRLAVRIGIHTGLVVVGEIGGGGRHEQLALGDTPNVAARLQGLAAPDTVVISAATHGLVQGHFTAADLGPQTLKGVAGPVPVYHTLGAGAAQSRLEVAAPAGLTPLVGRESEVALLLERWAQSQVGQGQVVLLSGEAGIGKSRLVEVVKDRIADTPHTWLECRYSPYYQNTALYPIIDLLERVLHFQRNETLDAKLEKLERALSQYCFALHETVPLFATLLSLPLPEVRTTQTEAEAVVALATEQGFPFWLAEATIFVGWALAAQGRGAEGTAQIHHGLATRQAIGLELTQPVHLTMLAEAYARVGQPTEGLTVLADAWTRVDTTGERWREAELHRLRGELLLAIAAENHREVEACFRQALDIARHQQAKALELRAATSLSRLWHRQGKRQEAHDLVAPIYGWFTEGFDTADLREAKTLVEELS